MESKGSHWIRVRERGYAVEEGIVDNGAGYPTEDAHDAPGVDDESVAGNYHGSGVS